MFLAQLEGPALSRGLWVAAILVLVILAFGSFKAHRGGGIAERGLATEAPAKFASASADRKFLTEEESLEAARRGLLPNGTRSIISTGGPLVHGDWHWDDSAVPPGPITVRVDLGRQLVSVFQGPDEIGAAVVVYGAQGKETPRGKLPILGKTRDYHSITYDAPMPYSLWLRDDGVALHGSSVRMGRATNGCIGVPVGFAEKLFAVAQVGDIIEVVGPGEPSVAL